MRYYNIVLTNPTTNKVVRQWSSLQPNGQHNPGALQVEFDILVYPYALPEVGSMLVIWGIPLADIGQAANFNGMLITIMGGMSKGLPLANPKQAGIIAQGYVFQAYGNWVGTDMTLNLIVAPGTGTLAQPKNLVLDWPKGTPLAAAIGTALRTAFPDYKQSIAISPNLVLASDQKGYYLTLSQFAAEVKRLSKAALGGAYQGVDILLTQTAFRVYDGTSQTTPKQLAFEDMIGQPTWIAPPTITAKLVMRADLNVGDYVKFPAGALATTTPAAAISPFRDKTVFQGTFQVTLLRHIGSLRQPTADAWVTVIEAIPVQAASGAGLAAPTAG